MVDFSAKKKAEIKSKALTAKRLNPLRMPPQSLESEMALLGALMIRPDAMMEATEVLTPEAFYSEKHRIIYRSMLALFSKNEPIDIESVRVKLADEESLDSIGGIAYLMPNITPSRCKKSICSAL
jgi:replicative DNA helicase